VNSLSDKSIDFSAVKNSVSLSDYAGRFIELKKKGSEYVGLCPFHDDHNPSFRIYRGDDGVERYRCFVCGAGSEGGDVIEFCKAIINVDAPEAVRILKGDMPPESNKTHKRQKLPTDESKCWKPIIPVPDDAPEYDPSRTFSPNQGAFKKYNPVRQDPYYTAKGELICYVVRLEFDNGDKICPTITYCEGPGGECRWCAKRMPAPHPILGLDHLAARPKDSVLIVSGEKCKDYGDNHLPGFVTVTLLGGDHCVDKADLTPLRDRWVVLFPDADDSGRQAMLKTGRRLEKLGCTIRYIDTKNLSKGYDLADLVDDGVAGEDLKKWCADRVKDGLPVIQTDKPKPAKTETSLKSKATEDAGLDEVGRQIESNQYRPVADPKPEPELEPPRIEVDDWPPLLQINENCDLCTDAANAQRFAEHNGRDLRAIDGLGWYHFNGSFWESAEHYADRCALELGSLIRTESIKKTIAASNTELSGAERESAHKLAEALLKWAKRSESSAQIAATKKLATAYLSLRPADMDIDPWLLNCTNGTLDLKTGKLRPAKHGDLITRSTYIRYDPNARYSLWEKTLLEVCCGDIELVCYLQRVFGYCLTGLTIEQVLFILNGGGANGKDTILGRIKNSMGDYAGLAAPSLLMLSRGGRHPTETADLFGIRMAIASESNENGKLNEVLVKQLTGSEKLKARKMYKDFFEFPALFKLMLMTNHRPIIEGSDYAIWRRINLIPFNAVFKKGVNRDDTLPGRLDQELNGILRWCVEGCLEWQRIGLQPPEVVIHATKQYKADQDVLSQFFDEKCVIKSQAQITAKKFYSTYEQWCADNGEKSKSQKWLWPKLSKRGITRDPNRMGVIYRGIGLLDPTGQ